MEKYKKIVLLNRTLSLNYYPSVKQLQFDLMDTINRTGVFANITVDNAKEIRKRLSEFIRTAK